MEEEDAIEAIEQQHFPLSIVITAMKGQGTTKDTFAFVVAALETAGVKATVAEVGVTKPRRAATNGGLR